MLNNIMQTFLELFSNIVLLNNIILVAFLVIFGFVFAHASMNKKSKLDWLDMLLDSDTQKLSLSKLGNFMGIALSSWMMIYFVQVPAAYGMFPSLFMAWLAFLGGVYTLNNFIKSRGKASDDEDADDTPPVAPPAPAVKPPPPPAK
jgi:hypothetical protein